MAAAGAGATCVVRDAVLDAHPVSATVAQTPEIIKRRMPGDYYGTLYVHMSPNPAVSRRILVVDDNEDSAESLTVLLRLQGHVVESANDGPQALEAAVRFRPDVILLDIGMPGMYGYEVCRETRKQPWGADILLIAQTGWGQDQDRQRTKDAGFDGHLTKPIDQDRLAEILTNLSYTAD